MGFNKIFRNKGALQEKRNKYGICPIWKKGLCLTFLIILAFLPKQVRSQFHFDHISIKNGLSQNSVHAIFKDSYGFYWFGTQDGLNQYDGYQIKTFKRSEEDSLTLSDNFILCIAEDAAGNLWIGTRNGLNFYSRGTGKFHRVMFRPEEKTDHHNNIWNIHVSKKGNIFYSNYYGDLIKIDLGKSPLPPFSQNLIGKNLVLFRTAPLKSVLYDVQTTHLSVLDDETIIKTQITGLPSLPAATTFLSLSDGSYWLGFSGGLFELRANREPRPLFPEKFVNCLGKDKEDNIWIGTTEGLLLYKRGKINTEPTEIRNQPGNIFSIASNNILTFYAGDSKNLWFGTSEGGASCLLKNAERFKVLNLYSSPALPGNAVWSICQDKNNLWVGTNHGAVCFTLAHDTLSGLFQGENRILSKKIYTHKKNNTNSPAGNFITALAIHKDGEVWFGTHDHGISVFNPKTNTWKHFHKDNSGLESNQVFHILHSNQGLSWISTANGFYQFDNKSGKIIRIDRLPENNDIQASYYFRSYENQERQIILCSTYGLFTLDERGRVTNRILSNPGNKKSLSYSMATSFLKSQTKKLWVGTLGGGINLKETESGDFIYFNEKKGLKSAVVYGILEDSEGRIWFTTNGGLHVIEEEQKTCAWYGPRDGLPCPEFIQNAYLKNEVGEFLLGTPEGLVIFNPSQFRPEKRRVNVLASQIYVNHEPVFFPGNILLEPSQRAISFEFAAPDFEIQEKINYSFMLEGFDSDWHPAKHQNRIATYTNLPPGDYVFKAKAFVDLMQGEAGFLEIPFTVIPPFWKKTWFIASSTALGILLLLLTGYTLSRIKYRRQLRAAELQQKLHREKERISRDLHDNIGSHLTYITNTIENISLDFKKPNSGLLENRLEELSDFSRNVIRELRETIWALNLQTITLNDLQSKILDLLNRASESAQIPIDFYFDPGDLTIIEAQRAIQALRITQEAVQNALKHSGTPRIRVSITRENKNALRFKIEDRGSGHFKTNKEGFGIGNMKKRALEMRSELIIEAKEGTGTSISFLLPV